MRYLTIITTLLLMITLGCANQDNTENGESSVESRFDQELADQLGADDYGMRSYVMAILKAGPNTDQDEEEAMELQRGHMANINRLAEEGVLVLAGPFSDGGEMRGIFIFDVETVEEARELTESDPAVQAGRLAMELHPWYGSAALLQINEIHDTISKETP
ncbi:MAG: YciI family protein [Balneolaceae bacterium]